MGVGDERCAPASFDTVRVPAPVYAYRLPLIVVDETGRDSGLEVAAAAAAARQRRMAEVAVPGPDDRSAPDLYWTERSLVDGANQLRLYGGAVHFDVQWEEAAAATTNSAGDNVARGVDPVCLSGSGPTHFITSWVRIGIGATHFLR